MTRPSIPAIDPRAAAAYRRAGWWGDETLAARVARNRAEAPDATAFVDPDGRLTWEDYDARSSAFAAKLAAAGVEAGDRVAVLLPDTAGVHVTFLACEKAGATVVGIGARAGDREIRHLLACTGAGTLVTAEHLHGRDMSTLADELRRDGALARHIVLVLPDHADHGGHGTGAEAAIAGRALGPDDVFMLNSTSGTTGLPKIVAHTENRWFYFHQLAVEAGRLTGEDVFLSVIPAPFGFGLWTAHFTPTILGAPCGLLDRFTPPAALDMIEQGRVTVLCCVSTQFLMLLEDPSFRSRDLSSLRCMFTGGEAVPYAHAAGFEDATGAAVLQFYGSNETGALSRTTLADDRDRRLRTAGRVIPEMQVRLYDTAGHEVTEPGGRGRPAARGPATCLGYLGDDAANRALVNDDGWMLMGDIVEIDHGGYLRVVGRTSDFIIRGGKNISAPAVEDEVTTHPAVALAAVVGMPDPIFGERVCAYVELRTGQDLTLDELVTHLSGRGISKEWLPEHLVVVDEIPRSSGGKIAKGQLRADIRTRLT